jgi:molecular chaperone GrpE (heat shock protein)
MQINLDEKFSEFSLDIIKMQKNFAASVSALRISLEAQQNDTMTSVLSLIDILDYVERLIEQDTSSSLERVAKKIKRSLGEKGIQAYDVQTVSAQHCRVVDTQNVPELPVGSVLRVVKKGYKTESTIVRLAEVVSNKH